MKLKSLGDENFQKNIEWMKKHPVYTGIIVIFLVIVLVEFLSGSSDSKPSTQVNQDNGQAVSQVSKDAAQKELDDLMSKSKSAGLVTSYEFSDKATEVYVGEIWYTQTVQFKKDFIAKIGMLKKTITGYSHFEVRDAYSNEKVGEITAFSQSIEVYK